MSAAAPIETPAATGDAAEVLVDFVAGTTFEDLPAPVVDTTKRLILDTLGAGIAGAGAPAISELRGLAGSWGGSPEARLWAAGDAVPAPVAALVNGAASRALELDEVHEVGLVHSAATMLPVALAVADRRGDVTGRELLTSVAVGIEVCIRLALATDMSLGGNQHVPRVMSLTTQAATLAGSLVAGRVAGVSRDQLANAFGAAYAAMPGNLQMLLEGSQMVRVMQGVSAQVAVQAADLARVGIDGPRQVLEGNAGFYPAFHRGRYSRERLIDGLGQEFVLPTVSIKPYACCKAGHTGISAAIAAAAQVPNGLVPDQVERIIVRVAGRDTWDILVDPLEVKGDPARLGADDAVALAQFSLPYMIACAVLRGRLTVADLTAEARNDADLRLLLSRMELVLDDTTHGVAALPEPGHVAIQLRDGRSFAGHADRVLGHPELPMSDEQVAEKFRANAQPLGQERTETVIRAVQTLEDLNDVRSLTDLLVL